MSLEPGQMLLHYRVVEQIGEGGMGTVWKAMDTTLDRGVAIKLLPEAFAADSERLARFEREAKLLAALNHPNIAAVHSVHEAPAQEGGHLPVIAVTAHAMKGDAEKCICAGMDSYLSKPINIDILLQTIGEVLSTARTSIRTEQLV